MAPLRTLLWSAPIILCMTGNAWAYLDPGTGSFALQAIIGTLVAGGFGLKLLWRRIVAKFRGEEPPHDGTRS